MDFKVTKHYSSPNLMQKFQIQYKKIELNGKDDLFC